MAYEKQTWTDNESVLSAARFNHMETGIHEAGRSGRILDIPASGLSHGDAIAFDGTDFIKTGQANYLFDGQDAVNHGVMSYVSTSADIGYTLYVQSDGSLDFGTTAVPCALVLSTNEIFVDFNPPFTNPKAYSGIMQDLLAMPGTSGYARVKVHFPEDADGVKMRGKSSAWTEGDDIKSGFEIANITDDTDLYGDNLWYEADIDTASDGMIADGDVVYIKCFPYAGTVTNNTIGENEIESTVGKLVLEYLPKNMSGSSVADSAGSNNATATNTTKGSGAGLVEDSFDMAAGYIELDAAVDIIDKTIVLYANFTEGADRGLFGNASTRNAWAFYDQSQGKVVAGGDNETNFYGVSQNGSEWFALGVYYSTGTAMKVWHNDDARNDAATRTGYTNINRIGFANVYSILGSGSSSMTGKICGVRIFDGPLTDTDFAHLYNGGDGC